jgi:hypothetical protein
MLRHLTWWRNKDVKEHATCILKEFLALKILRWNLWSFCSVLLFCKSEEEVTEAYLYLPHRCTVWKAIKKRLWINVYSKYRVIKKFLCTWWLQDRKLHVLFKVSPASLQGQWNTRRTLTTPVIPNSNYVIMVSDRDCLKYFCVFVL